MSTHHKKNAASDQGLHCLPWSHLWDARNIWVGININCDSRLSDFKTYFFSGQNQSQTRRVFRAN